MKKFTTLTLLALALSALPVPTVAAVSCAGKDTVAGMGSEIVCTGLVPGSSVSVRILPPLGAAVSLTGTSDDRGDARIVIPAEETQVAGSYGVSTEAASAQTTFTVLPETLDQRESSIEADRAEIAADGADEARIVVLLRDRYGNPLGNRPVQLLSSHSADRIRAITSETDGGGQQVFAFSTQRAGEANVRAVDLLSGKPLDAQITIVSGADRNGSGGDDNRYSSSVPVGEYRGRTLYGQVGSPFDVVDHFTIEIEGSASVPVLQDTTFRVTAKDRRENTVEDYTGTIRFSSTDPKAILPFGTRQFAPRDLGSKTFTLGLRFNTSGEQTLAVEDTSGGVQGSVTVNVTGGGHGTSASRIVITEPREGATVNSTTVIVTGSADPLINLIVTGGKGIARGDTDKNGVFRVPVTLDPALPEATLQVEEATGSFSSDLLHLRLDLQGPRIDSVTFDPEEPKEGAVTRIAVKSDPQSESVTMHLEGAPTPLEENPLEPGTYLGSFIAPKTAGAYQPTVAVLDGAGNKTEMLLSLTVRKKTPPAVRGLVAEPKANAVALTWSPLDRDLVDGYRVYVGDNAEDFAYSLDTDAGASAATVAGLKQAATYYFAVTALKEGTESQEKSDVVSATVLGIRLTAVPGDTTLMLKWNAAKEATPLSMFLLEYGIDPEQLTEKRMVHGSADSYTLRDLLNGVTYYCRLTPVSVPGELLRELAATAQGTPNGSGFRPVAGSGAHFTASDLLPPPPPPPPPSTVMQTGMPPITWSILFVGAAGCVFFVVYRQRRSAHRITTDFLREMQRQYRL